MLKGFIIGMLVSLPIGPLGLLSIQRTINKGWKIGFLSAIGAVTSDLVYSSLAILGISFIDNFVIKHRFFINGLTGILFLIVGINILSSGVEKGELKEDIEGERIHPFFVHFLMGLSNPMIFLIFFAIFTKMGIYVDEVTLPQHALFVISIFVGSTIQWYSITNLIDKSKKHYKFENFIFIDKIIGTVIILLGIFSVLKGITKL